MDDNLKKAIEQMKRGEEKGFNTIYSETYNRVYFRAKQIMKKEEDAQDLTQIVFTEAYKNINTLQSDEALYSWLDGITYHQGMKIYRKQKDVLLTEEAEGVFEKLESNDISSIPELTADQEATAKIIKGIIEELPELQKTSIVAYYYDGLKIEQIAEMMDCSVNTVKSRLNYARKYVKGRVEEKEKEGGYRLHVFGLPVLWYALKKLEEETTLTAYAAEKVYSGACSSLGLEATTISATGMTATEVVKGGIKNIVLKNAIIAGLGFTLSFAGAFGISQMSDVPIEITSVQEAQAVLDGVIVDRSEGESNTDTDTNADTEMVTTINQDATDTSQDTAEDTTQDTTQDVTEEQVEGEIQFDWSLDDWTYNGLHISEGVDAMARSVGLDPTLESDYSEHAQFGHMSYKKMDNSIELYEGKSRVTYREFIYEDGGNNSLDIQMNFGILDASGTPVDISDITGVPFSVGTLEQAETIFRVQEIMEKGTQVDSMTEEDNKSIRYEFSSNLGDGYLRTFYNPDGHMRCHQIAIKKDDVLYTTYVKVEGWCKNDKMYVASYSFR